MMLVQEGRCGNAILLLNIVDAGSGAARQWLPQGSVKVRGDPADLASAVNQIVSYHGVNP